MPRANPVSPSVPAPAGRTYAATRLPTPTSTSPQDVFARPLTRARVPVAVALGSTDGQPLVYLARTGAVTTSARGVAPKTVADEQAALLLLAQVIDDVDQNPFAAAGIAAASREKAFSALTSALERAQADAALSDLEKLQARSVTATVLLSLIEATPEPALRERLVAAYDGLIQAEPNRELKESMAFQLSVSPAMAFADVVAVMNGHQSVISPATPPYEKWFANGNTTLSIDFTVGGGGEFWGGFVDQLKKNGFVAVGAESQSGVSTYEKTVDRPGVGPTTFRIKLQEGGTRALEGMGDPDAHIVGYDGHANYGRNFTASVRNGPALDDAGDGKLVFYNLCVGKGVLDMFREKYGKAQIVTTWGSSMFYAPGGKMTDGEGVRALLNMLEGVSRRESWSELHDRLQAGAFIARRTWDNYLNPSMPSDVQRFSDLDDDGQADHVDRLFDPVITAAPVDAANDFVPVKHAAPASSLEGTRLYYAAQMVNRFAEFSQILSAINSDSKVSSLGFFEPDENTTELLRFSKVETDHGPEYRFTVNADFAHMSEEALRAVVAYEFSLNLGRSGELSLDPVDAKLYGLMLFAKSLSVDEGGREQEIFRAFKERYRLPDDLELSSAQSMLNAPPGGSTSTYHRYSAGTRDGLKRFREALTPEQLDALGRDDVGTPTVTP